MAKYSLKNLSWEEKKTGILFGFFRQLFFLSEKFRTNKFVFSWDSRSSLRREIYPKYKANRNKNKTVEEKEEDKIAYAQFNLLKDELLPSLGFKNIFEFEGYESDDIIAEIVKTNKMEFLIATSDEDMYQLLSDNVSIYNLSKKCIYTKEDFEKEYGITCDKWALHKAIIGCSTDNVEGIYGVGEKTALHYIKEEKLSVIQSQKIATNKNMIKRNLKLVELPFENTPDVSLDFDESLSFDVFVNICNRYGFFLFLKTPSLKKWSNYFQLV